MIKKDIKKAVTEYFFLNPASKMRLRELERTLKLPFPSIRRYVALLEKEQILSKYIVGEVIFYTASLTDTYLLEKKLYNIKQLYASGFIEHVKIELSNPPIILFGSYAKGEDVATSDIDLYIQTKSKKKIVVDKFEKKLQRTIQLFMFDDIHSITNPHLANNIINGITLNNYVEVFK